MNKQRRKELEKAVALLGEARAIIESVREEEDEAFDNMPDGIKESEKGEQMADNLDTMDSAIDAIEEQETAIDDIING